VKTKDLSKFRFHILQVRK